MAKKASSQRGIGLSETTAPMPMKMPKMSKEEMMYRAKDDMETMRRAEEIKMDPKRHGMVKKMATTHAAMLKKIGK